MMVSPRERGKYQGVMMAVMPVAMIGGPLIGGFITDNASWRWAFYVNLPLGVVSLVVVLVTLATLPTKRAPGKVRHRLVGAGLLTVWITSLVLITTWGGNQYDWASAQILGLVAVTVVGLVAFLLIERRVAEPIMPAAGVRQPQLHAWPARSASSPASRCSARITFLPQFQQFVQGASATNSGLLLMPMMIAAMVVLPGRRAGDQPTGHYRAFPIVGTVLLAVGLWLFSTMGVDTSTWETSALHGGPRRRHGLPDADHHADRAEQRRPSATSARPPAPRRSCATWAARSASPSSARSTPTT